MENIKKIFSTHLTLGSFLMLMAIFFSNKYSQGISLFLTFVWIMFLINKSRYCNIWLLLLCFIMGVLSFYFQQFWFSWNIPRNIENKEFTIISVSNNYVILKLKHWKILWWTNDQTIIVNQKIKIISSAVKEIEKTENSYNFSFSHFLNSRHVFFQLENPDWMNGSKPISPRFYFFQWLKNHNFHPLTKTFTWRQSFLPNFKKSTNKLDLGYLLVLNSFTFGILRKILLSIPQRVFHTRNRKIFSWVYALTWLSYWYLLSFNLIIFRFLISWFFKKIGGGIGVKSRRTLTLIIISWVQPNYFLQLNSWFLAIPYLLWPTQKVKTKWENLFLGMLIIIPLHTMLNYRFNLIHPILMIIFIPLFITIHCLSFLFWWIPGINFWWNICFEMLRFLVTIASKISLFWNIGHVPLILYIAYFFTLGFWLNNHHPKKIIILIVLEILLIILWTKIVLPKESIFMLNVGNGNSFLYINKYKNLVLIFDCGAGPKGVSDSMANFLKWQGINHVDYLFISHFHSDHYNGVEAVKDTVHVKQIITNQTTTLEWTFKGMVIKGWSLKNMGDINDESLVLLFQTGHRNLLFMGDLTKIGEEKLINSTDFAGVIKPIKIDLMQVGHHGSKNATSFELLYIVNPNHAFISSGVKNNHSFPDNETLELLEKLGIKTTISHHLNWSFNLISQKICAFR